MNTNLVAHLAVVGMLFGSTTAIQAQEADAPRTDAPEVRRPRLKLPRMGQDAPGPRAQLATPPAAATDGPKLGVMLDVTDDGFVVDEVSDGSLAAAAGIRAGDVLLKIGGRYIEDVEDIRATLRRTAPGERLALSVVRPGEGIVNLSATVPKPERPAAPKSPMADGHKGGFLGVQLGESDADGVPVAGVVDQSAAWFAGLDAGDVLLGIDGHAVSSGEDVVGAIASREPGAFVEVRWKRGDEVRESRVRLGSRSPAPGALGSFTTPQGTFVVPGVPAVPHVPGLRGRVQQAPDVRFFGNGGQGRGWRFDADDFPGFSIDTDDGGIWLFGGDDHDGRRMLLDVDDLRGKVMDLRGRVHGHDGDDLGDAFMLDLDDLGDAGSLRIEVEDGTLTIDRDGDVRVLDLDELEDAGDDVLKVLPKGFLQKIEDLDGDAHYEVKVFRSSSGDTTDRAPRVRRLSFVPGASTVTTVESGDGSCCTEGSAEVKAGACDADEDASSSEASVN